MRARAARGWQERLVAALMLMLKPVRARTGNRNERSATGSARMQKVDATATGHAPKRPLAVVDAILESAGLSPKPIRLASMTIIGRRSVPRDRPANTTLP
jgi:hypothetical protein